MTSTRDLAIVPGTYCVVVTYGALFLCFSDASAHLMQYTQQAIPFQIETNIHTFQGARLQ